MKLHILSDLHLGSGVLELPATDADVIVLAGDIARPSDALAWAGQFDKPVLYVAGNHEFYGGSIDGTLDELRRECEGTRVHVLDQGEFVIEGVRFLGATLWTDFELFTDPEQRSAAKEECQRLLRDFSRIRQREAAPDLFTPDASVALFRRHARWLADRLASRHDGPTVVITHHAPSRRSIAGRFADSLLNASFISDLEHLMGAGRAALWIHGHTHDSFDYEVGGTRVVCNPRGYSRNGINENALFDPAFIVEVQGAPPNPPTARGGSRDSC